MVSQNDPRQICVKCGGERPWQSSRQRGVRSWDDYNMCLRCAKVALPEEFKAPLDWLRDDCTCPGCGLVHKNPYQKHKLKNSQDINELKARIAELEQSQSPSKKEDALTQVETVIQSLRDDEKSTS